jgi:hypothetical protein
LKDIGKCPDCIYKKNKTACVDYVELRAEAIKLIKSFEKSRNISTRNKGYYHGALTEFKHFFNIEEGDLA